MESIEDDRINSRKEDC